MSKWSLLVTGVMLVAAGLSAAAAEKAVPAAEKPAAGPKEAVFEMKETRPERALTEGSSLLRGQAVQCQAEPQKEVKAFPKLKSKRPLYGTVIFDPDLRAPKTGLSFRFVLDESGEASVEREKSESGAKAGESALLKGIAAALVGKMPEQPKAPERKPPKPSTYDRLYFDLNRDLDLTNDKPLKPIPRPLPEMATPVFWDDSLQMTAFDWLDLPIDYGPPVGVRPFRVLPRLIVQDEKYAAVYFVAATCREGHIQIGPREYDAVLAQPYLISGRYDRTFTGLFLSSRSGRREYWWGSDELGALRRVDGRFYTVRATPLGDRLTVSPYEGKFGIFRIGPGARKLDTMGVVGSLRSAEAAVALGNSDPEARSVAPGAASSQHVAEERLPVGDYLPNYISLEYGRLRISISNNYHSDGKPRDMERRRLFTIPIREDKPFVFDFSNKPEVMFASPAKDQTFKPGDEVRVAGVLTDPVLDIMIRNLDDAKATRKQTIKVGDREQTVERSVSLDPTVTITDPSGKKVAEGVMPFG